MLYEIQICVPCAGALSPAVLTAASGPALTATAAAAATAAATVAAAAEAARRNCMGTVHVVVHQVGAQLYIIVLFVII